MLGTLNIFESIKKLKQEKSISNYSNDHTSKIVYASSAAVAGFSEDYDRPILDTTPHNPRTHYGNKDQMITK